MLDKLKQGGKIHKKIKENIIKNIKPNIKLYNLMIQIENEIKKYTIKENTIYNGLAFPVNLSLNNYAAHCHPNINDNSILTKDDIIKIDYGIEIDGWIIDSAFTYYFDDKYSNLNKAVKEANKLGIKNAKIDYNINDWAKDIKEILNSYDINPLSNLGGHNIIRYNVHGGEYLPLQPYDYFQDKRFHEGIYAIEIFGSDGETEAIEDIGGNIYKINNNPNINNLKLKSSVKFYNDIKKKFKTLPFSNRYLNDIKNEIQLDILTKNKILTKYPPLMITNGNISQFEHTIYIDEKTNKILS